MDEYLSEVEGCARLVPTWQEDKYSGEVEGHVGSGKQRNEGMDRQQDYCMIDRYNPLKQ
jgi:hypothetical protein